MADSPLIDIFDLCVERLAAGETVEDCLRDYPEYAEELRGLLETGFLVFQAQADPVAEKQAQAHTRSRIEQALQTDFAPHKGNNMSTDLEPRKKKPTAFTIRRSAIWISASAAAVFVFTLGFAFATSGSQPVGIMAAGADFPLTATAYIAEATALADADPDRDGLSNIRESQIGADPQNADTDGDGIEDGIEVQVWNTVPTKFDSDGDGLSDGDEISKHGTNPLNVDSDSDDFSDSEEINMLRNPLLSDKPEDIEARDKAFILTATQYVLEVTQTAVAEMALSGTPVAMLNPDATNTITTTPTVTTTSTATREFSLPTLAPVGTTVPVGASSGSSDTAVMGDVASTSVALYLPMTATPGAFDEAEISGVSADKNKDLEHGLGDDEFRADTSTDVIIPYSGPAIPLPTAVLGTTGGDGFAVTTPLSGTTGMLAPVNMQDPLDPMKAGEIDDNAEWDTYTEFRRNYITSFGDWTVNDFDVSGRRIIKVIDALGKPVLGARVVVYMDQLEISNTYTYATGMTLFFPNALEATKRRDEFRISVIYDQHEVTYTLDLRKVGDIVEIQMPIVIVRDPSASPIGSYTEHPLVENAVENATTAAENARAAETSAAAASENATRAAENLRAVETASAAADAAATANYLAGTALPPTPTPATR